MKKATFKEKWYDKQNKCFVLVYKYRGHEYSVCDYGWRGGEPLNWQHKNEQGRIDAEIDNEGTCEKPYRYEDTADYGFRLFWEMVEEQTEGNV